MSMWQDESFRGSRSGAGVDTARAAEPRTDGGQPMSRREAREAERRAAEALAEGRMHPSGVVDFGNADPRGRIDPDQDFSAQNTADIWAALSRRADAPAPQQETPQPPADFRPAMPESFGRAPATGPSAVSGELLDRVRDAVLRREREPEVLPTARIPVQQPVEPPLSRRDRRVAQAAEVTEDGMPAAWFSDAAPASQVPAAFGGPAATEYEDYDDAPTVAMSMPALDRAALEAQAPMTAPVGLPQFFVEPQGDDAISFSSPTPVVTPGRHPFEVAQQGPAFLEPQGGEADDDDYDDEPEQQAIPGWGAPAATAWSNVPAEPQQEAASWAPEQLGPPSEITDLAGFEALIRRARSAQTGQSSAQPPQAAPRRMEQPRQAPLPWKEPEELDEHTGFLTRGTTTSGTGGALILPNDPQPDLTQAVSGTGDIFITGSLNLPKRLAQTGAPIDAIDSPDVDRLYEHAQEDHAPGVKPVSANRAISGAGSGKAMLGGRRLSANILPTVLAIIAGAMAVGVVALLVGSWVLKLF